VWKKAISRGRGLKFRKFQCRADGGRGVYQKKKGKILEKKIGQKMLVTITLNMAATCVPTSITDMRFYTTRGDR